MAEPVRQSNSLPSLSYMDLEKLKKEAPVYAHHIPISAALSMAAPPLASPSIYSGPPPPYSYPSSTTSSVIGVNNGNNGYISPPESRQTSDHEKEVIKPPKLQSLPSIHEALGKEQHMSIGSILSKTNAVTQASPTSTSQTPTSPNVRPYSDASIRPPPPPSNHPPPMSYRIQDPPDQSRPRYSPQLPKDISAVRQQHPAQHHISPPQTSRTVSSPTERSRPMAQAMPSSQQTSPIAYDYPRSNGSQTNNYTYSPYHPAYSYAMQPPSLPAYQVPQLQPPPPSSTWRSVTSDLERAEEARKAASKDTPMTQSFGETVKRHLDRFDLEVSLNEIAEGSSRIQHFSDKYRTKTHNSQRAGLTLDSTPSLTECDDIIKYQRGVLSSMERIREVILKQQQDLAEQRNRNQPYKTSSDYDEESLYGDKLDGLGGFNGPDAKKRKGRAAPPGRCHSCNRAETPEWRRGPDGARTLCNACGLHYAKLTRKMGSKSSTTGSNLRPKESSPTLAQ